ncbi:hypothetical protein V5799_011872 [Amblyomma americanum]|uniref:Uncharacterized protein n=1 Tax=Amblyomma americanum TaxID=6943 RepID=A0AAQ4EFK7_AMBAM
MSRLPVDRPYLHMRKATFDKLPFHTKALKSFLKITPHGLRTPWKTGSSVVQPVKSDVLVYGPACVGLNVHMDTGMCRVTRAVSGNPMKATSLQLFSETDHATFAKYFWGLKITPGSKTEQGDEATDVPTSMGTPRHNFAYDFVHIKDTSPRLTKFVNQFPFKGRVAVTGRNCSQVSRLRRRHPRQASGAFPVCCDGHPLLKPSPVHEEQRAAERPQQRRT